MQYIDGAQISLYAFWLFFLGLVIYLRREDKREGYPLESPQGPREGFPRVPEQKKWITRPEPGGPGGPVPGAGTMTRAEDA
jgi:photosynthetic reaction center H subunit